MSEPAENWIRIGKLGRPHGFRGGLKFIPYGEMFPEVGNVLKLELGNRSCVIHVDAVKGGGRFEVKELSDRTQASEWTNAHVLIERSHMPAPNDDEYYLVDIIGAAVIRYTTEQSDLDALVKLGTLEGFETHTPQLLGRVRTASKKIVLVPWVSAIVINIDLESHTVVLDPPVGLFPE